MNKESNFGRHLIKEPMQINVSMEWSEQMRPDFARQEAMLKLSHAAHKDCRSCQYAEINSFKDHTRVMTVYRAGCKLVACEKANWHKSGRPLTSQKSYVPFDFQANFENKPDDYGYERLSAKPEISMQDIEDLMSPDAPSVEGAGAW